MEQTCDLYTIVRAVGREKKRGGEGKGKVNTKVNVERRKDFFRGRGKREEGERGVLPSEDGRYTEGWWESGRSIQQQASRCD